MSAVEGVSLQFCSPNGASPKLHLHTILFLRKKKNFHASAAMEEAECAGADLMVSEEYCIECQAVGLKTHPEKYRNITLKLCTAHYWMKKAKGLGFSLEEYISRSTKFSFSVSLPEGDINKILSSAGN